MDALPTILADSTAGVVLRYAAAFFLVVVAIGLVYMLIRAGRALQSVDKLVTDIDAEVVPVINKAGTTVDEVNAELGKVNDITASVAEMTERVDSATRVVETALSTPAKKAAAFTSGVTQAVSSFFSRHGASFNDESGGAGEASEGSTIVTSAGPASDASAVAVGDAPTSAASEAFADTVSNPSGGAASGSADPVAGEPADKSSPDVTAWSRFGAAEPAATPDATETTMEMPTGDVAEERLS